jgi:hypothetical protein
VTIVSSVIYSIYIVLPSRSSNYFTMIIDAKYRYRYIL